MSVSRRVLRYSLLRPLFLVLNCTRYLSPVNPNILLDEKELEDI